MFAAMLSAFWAYDGWSNISFVTGEIKNPKRNVPLAIMCGVSIAMLLYVLVNYAYMHVLSLPQLAAVDKNTIGAVVVAEEIIGAAGKTLIIALIMVSVFGTLNGIILAHSRVYFRMAQEQYFFKKAANVHPTYRTPYISLLYTMIWSSILVISGTFDMLTDMVIFAGFLFYGLLAVAVIKMKQKGINKSKSDWLPGNPRYHYFIFNSTYHQHGNGAAQAIIDRTWTCIKQRAILLLFQKAAEQEQQQNNMSDEENTEGQLPDTSSRYRNGKPLPGQAGREPETRATSNIKHRTSN